MNAKDRVRVENGRLAVHFADFGIEHYDLFLRCKRLPESAVEFHPADETYTVTAPARFAAMLGVETPAAGDPPLPLADCLFDDQRAIVQMALDAKRFAVWSDCGLGKTLVGLEFARQVIARTGGRVLVTTMNEIVGQWAEESARFYGDALPVYRIQSRKEMIRWCAGDGPGKLAVVNYEKWNPEDLARQVVSEAKALAGVILDESSRLKTGGGKQKWAVIKSCRGVEYKLSLTATPAPNDTMEFASQASFLEKMRSEGEIIWTYFVRDNTTHRWTVKPHARKAFFEFMAGWSIYVRDPKRYGWRLGMADVPPPVVLKHEIEPTEEQRAFVRRFTAQADAEGRSALVLLKDANAIHRGKLSQVAKGFRYLKGESARKYERIDSRKPAFVADLVRSEAAAGLQVLVWTVFDAESTILSDLLRGTVAFDLLTGRTADADRLAALDRFRRGESRVLISRASMLGYGMNMQHCGSMIFSGFNDSYESFYQAIRRAYRYGQTRAVRVHIPVVTDLEEDMLDNLFRKQEKHEDAIAEMEHNYVAARGRMGGPRE